MQNADNAPKVEFLSYLDLAEKANTLYQRYASLRSVPADIERLVEIDFRIGIVPLPNLNKVVGLDGFVTREQEIYVDEHYYNHQFNRYRFTLAHEFAHYYLHKALIDYYAPRTLDEFQAGCRMPDEQSEWAEWQANSFAGLLLVPPAVFAKDWQQIRQQVQSEWESKQKIVPPSDTLENLLEEVTIEKLAKRYEVSSAVVRTRRILYQKHGV